MKTVAVLMLAVFSGVAVGQDGPKLPAPQKEHEWLKQLVGEWETETEAVMEPGKPPMKCKGRETVRSLGGFWTHAELTGDMMGTPVTGFMTLGYDGRTKKYVGTWVCSMDGHLWKYEGTLDASGKVLTLETEGPGMTGKLAKMRDVIEIKDKDHKVLSSYALGDDGKWTQFMTLTAKRAKERR
jgi:hypothetical protein